jgi:hypothetical protein
MLSLSWPCLPVKGSILGTEPQSTSSLCRTGTFAVLDTHHTRHTKKMRFGGITSRSSPLVIARETIWEDADPLSGAQPVVCLKAEGRPRTELVVY